MRSYHRIPFDVSFCLYFYKHIQFGYVIQTLFRDQTVTSCSITIMSFPKLKFKAAIINALTYGLALEIFAIGTGYYLYREYNTNEGKQFDIKSN